MDWEVQWQMASGRAGSRFSNDVYVCMCVCVLSVSFVLNSLSHVVAKMSFDSPRLTSTS